MAADAPWTKWYHDDFLQGVNLANLTAEEIGVYTVVLSLIAARGGPVEADSRWINGFANCGTVRKCTAVIDRLIVKGKLERRGNLLGNARMIRVVQERNAKSAQASKAALARWHGDDLELPLEQPRPAQKQADKRGDKQEDKHRDKSEINRKKPQKTAIPADADASPPVRARDSETQNILNPTHPKNLEVVSAGEASPGEAGGSTEPQGDKPPLLRDADLAALYDAVCDASGFATSSPGAIDRAMRQVEAWRADRIDFDEVVIPAIRAMTAKSTEPTRLLSRFDKHVRLEHAKRKGTNGSGRAYVAPASPVTLRDGEDPRVQPFREALLAALGPAAYVRLANKVRVEIVEERNVVRIKDPRVPYLTDDGRAGLVKRCAERCGFKGVW